MLYTVLLSNHHQFRIGLRFIKFKENGRSLLEAHLSNRSPLANQKMNRRIVITCSKRILGGFDGAGVAGAVIDLKLQGKARWT